MPGKTSPTTGRLRWRLDRGRLAGYGFLADEPVGDLGSNPDTQSVPDVLKVTVRRPFGDEESLCDLAVGQALGHERRHLQLAPSQPRLLSPCQASVPAFRQYWPKNGYRKRGTEMGPLPLGAGQRRT